MKRLAPLAVLASALALAPAVVAATPPAPAAPDLDAASDTGATSTDGVTADTTPTFTVDAGAAQAGLSVQLYATGSSGAAAATGTAAVVPASGIVTLTAGALADGSYSITAVTTSGLDASRSSPALAVVIDTTAPVLEDAPVLLDFAGLSGTLSFTTTPRFAVAATTDVTVTLYEGATAVGSAVSAAGVATVTVSSPRAQGSHTVFARGTDLAGNVSDDSPATTFTVDSLTPATSAVALYPADDDGASTTDRVTSSPRPRLEVHTEAGARVTLYEDGVALGSAVAGPTGVALVRPTDLQWLDPGVHCLTTIAVDAAGNAADETDDYCLTVAEGVEPFTVNLGASLGETTLALSLRSTQAARVRVSVRRGHRVVARKARVVRAGRRTRVVLHVPRRGHRLRVTVRVRTADGRTRTLHRVVRR